MVYTVNFPRGKISIVRTIKSLISPSVGINSYLFSELLFIPHHYNWILSCKTPASFIPICLTKESLGFIWFNGFLNFHCSTINHIGTYIRHKWIRSSVFWRFVLSTSTITNPRILLWQCSVQLLNMLVSLRSAYILYMTPAPCISDSIDTLSTDIFSV